ncbi:hypothetical protein Tco_0765971 [Tanacetum coccineum]
MEDGRDGKGFWRFSGLWAVRGDREADYDREKLIRRAPIARVNDADTAPLLQRLPRNPRCRAGTPPTSQAVDRGEDSIVIKEMMMKAKTAKHTKMIIGVTRYMMKVKGFVEAVQKDYGLCESQWPDVYACGGAIVFILGASRTPCWGTQPELKLLGR